MTINDFIEELSKIGIEVDEKKLSDLERYFKLLVEWNLKMNLGGYYTEPQGDEYTDPAHINEEGFFWSSTRISNRNSRGFWFSPNASNYSYPMARNMAAQVRCVSR